MPINYERIKELIENYNQKKESGEIKNHKE